MLHCVGAQIPVVRAIGSLTIALLLTAALWLGHFKGQVPDDFVAYYAAGSLVLDGQSPYDFRSLTDIIARIAPYSVPVRIFNPPISIAALCPLSILPLEGAFFATTTVSLLFILLLPSLLFPTITARHNLYAIGACLTFIPTISCLRMGQLTLIATLLTLASWRSLASSRAGLAGLLLSPVLLKSGPFLVMIAVLTFLGAQASWRRFLLGISFIPVISTFLLLPELQEVYSQYLHNLSIATTRIPLSVVGTLQSWFFASTGERAQLLRLLIPLSAIVLAVLLLRAATVADKGDQRYFFTTVASITASPFCYLFDIVALLPIIASCIVRSWSRPWLLVTCGAVVLFQFTEAGISGRQIVLLWATVPLLWGLLLVWSSGGVRQDPHPLEK